MLSELFIDEHGSTQHKQIPKNNVKSFKQIQEEASINQNKISKEIKHQIEKDIVEKDKFNNKSIINILLNENGPK